MRAYLRGGGGGWMMRSPVEGGPLLTLPPVPALPQEGRQTCSFKGASSSREDCLGRADPLKQDFAVIRSIGFGNGPARTP